MNEQSLHSSQLTSTERAILVQNAESARGYKLEELIAASQSFDVFLRLIGIDQSPRSSIPKNGMSGRGH